MPLRNSRRYAANLSFKMFGETDVDTEEPPIFLFHGLLGCKKHWEASAKTMVSMTRRAVVGVDLRNHGDSPHVSSHRYDEMAEDILQLFDKLSVDKASVVGHGMGGRTIMCLALLAPDKIASLLVVDISPVSTCNHFKEYMLKVMKAMKDISFKKQTKVVEAKHEVIRKLKNIINDKFIMDAVLSNVIIKSNGKLGWRCNIDILIQDFRYLEIFPKYKNKKYNGPALFIGGQQSDYIPPDDLIGIRELYPRAVVTYIPQSGHICYVDAEKPFLEIALAFLKTIHE